MTHPLTNALAMRTAAAEACTDIIKKYDVMKPDGVTYEPMRVQRAAKGMVSIAREDILALPLKADRTALLAEAVKVLHDDIAAQHKRVMSGEQRFYAKNITNACSEMGGPLGNAVERLIAALIALETP